MLEFCSFWRWIMWLWMINWRPLMPRKRNGEVFIFFLQRWRCKKRRQSKGEEFRFAEELQTDIGVARVRQWAKENNALKDDDIFISTNVDEVLNNLQKRFHKVFISKVLSREALHKLRWCKTTHSVLSGALWMPIGRFPTLHFVNCFVFQLFKSIQEIKQVWFSLENRSNCG